MNKKKENKLHVSIALFLNVVAWLLFFSSTFWNSDIGGKDFGGEITKLGIILIFVLASCIVSFIPLVRGGKNKKRIRFLAAILIVNPITYVLLTSIVVSLLDI